MSGLRKIMNALKKSQRAEKKCVESNVESNGPLGGTVYPKEEAQQVKVGVRWGRDVAIVLKDGTTINRYKLQANTQAESPRVD
jgi:hypothetical protein